MNPDTASLHTTAEVDAMPPKQRERMMEVRMPARIDVVRLLGFKPQRNHPCPCGSGKKWKKCCESAKPEDLFIRMAKSPNEALRRRMLELAVTLAHRDRPPATDANVYRGVTRLGTGGVGDRKFTIEALASIVRHVYQRPVPVILSPDAIDGETVADGAIKGMVHRAEIEPQEGRLLLHIQWIGTTHAGHLWTEMIQPDLFMFAGAYNVQHDDPKDDKVITSAKPIAFIPMRVTATGLVPFEDGEVLKLAEKGVATAAATITKMAEPKPDAAPADLSVEPHPAEGQP